MTRWNGVLFSFALGIGSIFISNGASASTVAPEWYFGDWRCTIDGRPAQMRWRVVDDPRTTCVGDLCTRTFGVAIRGWFWDRSGPWATLTRLSSGPSFLAMRHADGNRWRLNRINANFASGWTTWSGRRFPLQCSR